MEIADIFVVNKADREGRRSDGGVDRGDLSLQTLRRRGVAAADRQDRGDHRRGRGRAAGRRSSGSARTPQRHARRAAPCARRVPAAELLAQRFVQHVERRVLGAGEFERLLDRIADARDRSLHGGRRRSWPTLGSRVATMKATSRSRRHRGGGPRAALAFYRDALGLEVEAPEDVPSQRVRAHFIPVGRVGPRAARGDRRRLADREVRREARSRPAPHHAAGRRHRARRWRS